MTPPILPIIGKEEWCALSELGLPAIKARIDSGARTSALHAFNIKTEKQGGESYVSFEIHPIQKTRKFVRKCRAKVLGVREVKSSNGTVEQRVVIETTLTLGDQSWPIEVTLTNRDDMGYRMLIGRQAMEGLVLVDPGQSFLLTKLGDTEAKNFYRKEKERTGGLKIVVLASNRQLYSNRRLIEAGKQRGHEIRFLNVKYCTMNISRDNPTIHYRGGEVIEHVDAVIPRLRPSMTFYGCAVARQFQSMGAYCLNDAVAIARARDKLRTLQIFSNKQIDMPITGFAHSPHDTKDLIKMVGGAPLVIKLLEGTQGVGVVLAETNKAAESVINAFKSLQANILVQEFIKEAQGSDIRCFVIDGKVVGAMERRSQDGDFRANLHLGGTARAIKITPQERKLAVKAAKAIGLPVAGVDLIRSDSGPKLLEVNSSPGLEGIEQVTGKDIAGLMIESIERYMEDKS